MWSASQGHKEIGRRLVWGSVKGNKDLHRGSPTQQNMTLYPEKKVWWMLREYVELIPDLLHFSYLYPILSFIFLFSILFHL